MLDVVTGKTYRIEVCIFGDRIAYVVNGTLIFDQDVDKLDTKSRPVPSRGFVGFRTWASDVSWDNLRVTRLVNKEQMRSALS